MSEPQPGSENAALLLLIREMSGGMQSLRENGAKQSEDVHGVRLSMAEIGAKLEPLGQAVTQVNALSTQMALVRAKLDVLDGHETRITALEAVHNQRKGWETPAGKLAYIIGSAVLGALTATGIALLLGRLA